MDSLSRKILENAQALKRKRKFGDTNSQDKENQLSEDKLFDSEVGEKVPPIGNKVKRDINTAIGSPSIKERLTMLNSSIRNDQFDSSKTKSRVNSEIESIINLRRQRFGGSPIKPIIEISKPVTEDVQSVTATSLSEISDSFSNSSIIEPPSNLESSESLEIPELPKPEISKDIAENKKEIPKISPPHISHIVYPSTPSTPNVYISKPSPSIKTTNLNNYSIIESPMKTVPQIIVRNKNSGCNARVLMEESALDNPHHYQSDSLADFNFTFSPSYDEQTNDLEKCGSITTEDPQITTNCLLHNPNSLKTALKECNEAIQKVQNIIFQSSQALNTAYNKEKIKKSHIYEAIEAERILLFSIQKKKILEERHSWLKEENFVCTCNLSQTFVYYVDVVISEISIFIKKEYFLSNSKEAGIYYFVLIISSKTTVFSTDVLSIYDVDKDELKFKTNFHFSSLLSSDKIRIQLYAFFPNVLGSIRNKDTNFRFGSLKFLKRDTTPKIIKSVPKALSASTYQDSAIKPIRSSNFNYVGELSVCADKSISQKLHFDNTIFECPITGDIFIKLSSEFKEKCQATGFLTFFDQHNSNTWIRYWCGLFREHVSFWKYPADEKSKASVFQLNLDWNGSSDSIRLLSSIECPRAHTFEISLKSLDSNDIKGYRLKKYWFAADSKEERNKWMDYFMIHCKNFNNNKLKH